MTSATSTTGETPGGPAGAGGGAAAGASDASGASGAPGRRSPDALQRIIEAAAEAFADKGFHATTTRDIAARAGLSPAGVYVHFSSKEDLLFALSRQGHVAALDLVQGAGTRGGSPSQQLQGIVSEFARWHAEHFRTARIVQYEFPHLSPDHRDEVLALRKQIDAVLRRVLTAGVRSGDFEVPDVPGTTLALLSMCIDVARWFEPGIRRTPEAIGTAYGSLALRLVRP